MILVDTSVWADHFRRLDDDLVQQLRGEQVVTHSFVIGELALGYFRDWEATVAMLRAIPRVKVASEAEMLALIANERIAGTGIGFVDTHLLASCLLTTDTHLWARDKRLAAKAEALGVAWAP